MENIFTTIEPFCIVMKMFGIFPISFDGPAYKGVFKTTFCDALATIISLCLLLLIIIANMLYDESVLTSSLMLTKAFSFLIRTELFSMILMFAYQIYFRKSIVEFIKWINIFDQKVNQID